MSFRVLAVLFVFVLGSCGTKNYYSAAPKVDVPKISKSKLIKKNIATSFKNSAPKTVRVNSKLSYKIGDSAQKLGLKIRIAKGEKMWLSADFLNIPVAKMLITKDSVLYYNKFDKTYFKGSFELINQLIGMDVNYQTVENIFTGDLIIDLDKGPYKLTREENVYVFRNLDLGFKTKKIELYPISHKPKLQSIKNFGDEKSFATYYDKFQNVKGILFPKTFEVKARNQDKKSTIGVNYTSVTFDQELKFPFKIPKDCTKELQLNSGKNAKRK